MGNETARARAPPAAVPPPLPPLASVKETESATGERQWFSVELRSGETTIVSWKKLLREMGKGDWPVATASGADRDPEGQVTQVTSTAMVQPVQSEPKCTVLPLNRFSAVVEKIEHLYMGKESSDEEELNDVPDDDQYDTEDSFIDDAELDEYFQVEKLETKHNGYFVNRGKLDQIEPSSYLNVPPKIRRRKDSTRDCSGRDGGINPMDPVNMGNAWIKSAAQNASRGRKLSGPSKVLTLADHYQEGELFKSKVNPTVTYKNKTADVVIGLVNPSFVEVPYRDALALPLETKNIDKKRIDDITSRDLGHKGRTSSDSLNSAYQALQDKAVSSEVESQSKRLPNGERDAEVFEKVRRNEGNGIKFPEMHTSRSVHPMQELQLSTTRLKEGSAVRPKGTTLERAIRDLEKIVSECRPPDLVIQEADNPSQLVKRRLPREVKLSLAKVARLSANQCKYSEDDIVDRLMSILGHLVQRKTLKRNMKEMVELGLSVKQQKADRFRHVKEEANEMIRTRVSHLKTKLAEHQDALAVDFQDAPSNYERRALIGKYSMDKALEDKMYDLYDLYVEGMDEDKGPQSRKLYVELAELWPSGYMDNHGIKEAICRSKERKMTMHKRGSRGK